MTAELEDLITPLTRQQIEAKIYEVMAVVGTRTTSWKPGSPLRTMITASSIMASAFSALSAAVARSGFLDTATGSWLAVLAEKTYNVQKRYATFASGEVTLVNAGGGIYTMGADDLVLSNPDTGAQYRNSASFTLGSLATVTVPIRAIEAGAGGSSAPGTIVTLVTPLIGVSASNELPVVGLDDEEDPELRAHCSEKLGSLSPFGPWDAYSYAARSAQRLDGTPVAVNRVSVSADGFGNVDVYVATPSGSTPGSVGDLTSDLGAVDDAIQRQAAPLAITAVVASATPLVVPVAMRLWVLNTTKLTRDQIEAAVTSKLLAFFRTQPIGGHVVGGPPGKLYVDALISTISSALPEIIHVVLDGLTADIDVDPPEVPVAGALTFPAITMVVPSGAEV